MTVSNWSQIIGDLIQALISGLTIALVVYWLDERRAKRERRLADFRLASNWSSSLEPKTSLKCFDLSYSNLSGQKFPTANMEETQFYKARLSATDFSETNLRNTNFSRTKIRGGKFNRAIAINSIFSHSNIRGRTDPDYIYAPDFSDAVLVNSSFVSAELVKVKFSGANLTNANFKSAIVVECDFTGAVLTGSQWRKVRNVQNCIWKDVKGADPENVPDDLWREIQRPNN